MFQSIANYISEVLRGKKVRVAGRDAQWRKVADIKVGDRIAVTKDKTMDKWPNSYMAKKPSDHLTIEQPDNSDVEWDEIVSIKRLSPERVYDIEVEDTHNFVAGHFIDMPLPGTEALLTDEPGRGPPANNNKIFGGIIAHNTYAAIFNGGNVGIGDTSPASALTVGSGDLFQVNSSGAIAAAAGVTSSGTITFTGLGTGTDNSVVILNASNQLTTDEIDPDVWTAVDNYGDWDWYMNGVKQKDITTGATAGIDEGTAIDLSYNDTRDIAVAFDSTELGTTTWYNGTAGTDIVWTFDGETNDGTFGYYEDEDAISVTNAVVGIGTTAPTATYELDVNGEIIANGLWDRSGTGSYIDPANATKSMVLASAADIGGVLTLTNGSNISGNNNAVGIVGVSGGTDICVGGGSCTGKIDAGTVDPPYTINGKKYATYMLSMTGVKEETTGIIELRSKNQELRAYEYEINFNNQSEGSDLWLFAKTTNLKNIMDKMTVLLTPSDNTRTWYKTDKENYKLTIYSSRPTTISYRLTAPRFDYENHRNDRPDNSSIGFIINDEDKPVTLAENGDVGTLDGIPYAEIIQINPTSPSATLGAGAEYVYDGNLDIETQSYDVKLKTNELVDEFIAATNAYFGKITSGLVEAQDIIVNNVLVAKNIVSENVTSYMLQAKNLFVSEKIISPVVETESLKATGSAELNKIAANEIKPQNNDLVIDLSQPPSSNDKGPLHRIIIKGLAGKTAAVIDAEGNVYTEGDISARSASFSGTLTAAQVESEKLKVKNLEGQEATISGTLIAGNVQSENITNLESQVSSSSATISQLSTFNSQLSTDINDIQKLLADIKNQPLPDAQYYQNLNQNSVSGIQYPVSDIQNTEYSILNTQSLTVTGNSNLYNVSVSNSLLVGSLFMENNKILSLASDLRLSSLGTITLFDNAVVIAKNGTITTTGELIAQKGVRTDTIRPTNKNNNIAVELNSNEIRNSQFEIRNSEGDTVASVDASGSAQFNNVAMKQLNLDKYMDATQSGAIIAAADNFAQNGIFSPAIQTEAQVAGVAILPANSNEVIIYNSSVKEDSLIYITPTSPINPTPLTVSQKVIGEKTYFKVTTGTKTHPEIKFNWLIIN